MKNKKIPNRVTEKSIIMEVGCKKERLTANTNIWFEKRFEKNIKSDKNVLVVFSVYIIVYFLTLLFLIMYAKYKL